MSKNPKRVPDAVVCEWEEYESTGTYNTQCGKACYPSEKDMKDSQYAYCPYCGKRINLLQ